MVSGLLRQRRLLVQPRNQPALGQRLVLTIRHSAQRLVLTGLVRSSLLPERRLHGRVTTSQQLLGPIPVMTVAIRPVTEL